MGEKVRMVGSLQDQMVRLEDTSNEARSHLASLSARLSQEQEKSLAAEELAESLKSKFQVFSVSLFLNEIFWVKSYCFFFSNFNTNLKFIAKI